MHKNTLSYVITLRKGHEVYKLVHLYSLQSLSIKKYKNHELLCDNSYKNEDIYKYDSFFLHPAFYLICADLYGSVLNQ